MSNRFEFIKEVMYSAAAIMLKAHDMENVKHSKNGDQNFVTEFDVAVQNYLVTEIKRLCSDAVFICEETDNDPAVLNSGKPCFIIDPIDGTTNFIHNFRHSAISVGVCVNNEIVYGAVYDPYTDSMYFASKGEGSYMTQNGTTIELHVNNTPLNDCIMMYGASPYSRGEYCDITFTTLKQVFLHSREIRCLGSAALHICYVARGQAGGFFEYTLQPWDYAAGSLILSEAGGVATDMKGEPLSFAHQSSFLGGCEKVYSELREAEWFNVIK